MFRAASANPNVKVNAVNDPFMPLDYTVNQLQYDSVHQRFIGTTNSIQVIARQQLGVVTFIVFSVSSKCRRNWRTQRCTAPRISGTTSSADKHDVLDPNGTSEDVAGRRG